MTALNPLAMPANSFISDVSVTDIGGSDAALSGDIDHGDELVHDVMESGTARVTTSDNGPARLGFPVYGEGRIVSVVCIDGRIPDDVVADPVGVFEVWQPIGIYEEVALVSGNYGKMERFQNVSQFVRFEKGNGLPGQVWSQRRAQIHDDLSNHPGFLRAAGASADLLQSAIGIPVADDALRSVVVLISSKSTPIARSMEVFSVDGDQFQLTSSAYWDVEDGFQLPAETIVEADPGVLGMTLQRRGACVVDDVSAASFGRKVDPASPCPSSGLAIPFFEGATISSVALLLF